MSQKSKKVKFFFKIIIKLVSLNSKQFTFFYKKRQKQMENLFQTKQQKQDYIDKLKQINPETYDFSMIINFLERGQSIHTVMIYKIILIKYGPKSEIYRQFKNKAQNRCIQVDYTCWLKQQLDLFCINPVKWLQMKTENIPVIPPIFSSQKIKFTNTDSFSQNQNSWLDIILENLTRSMLIKAFTIIPKKSDSVTSLIYLLQKPINYQKIKTLYLPDNESLKNRTNNITQNIMQIVEHDVLASIANDIIKENQRFFPRQYEELVERDRILRQQQIQENQQFKRMINMDMIRQKRQQSMCQQDLKYEYNQNYTHKQLEYSPFILNDVQFQEKPTINPNKFKQYLKQIRQRKMLVQQPTPKHQPQTPIQPSVIKQDSSNLAQISKISQGKKQKKLTNIRINNFPIPTSFQKKIEQPPMIRKYASINIKSIKPIEKLVKNQNVMDVEQQEQVEIKDQELEMLKGQQPSSEYYQKTLDQTCKNFAELKSRQKQSELEQEFVKGFNSTNKVRLVGSNIVKRIQKQLPQIQQPRKIEIKQGTKRPPVYPKINLKYTMPNPPSSR